MWRGRLRRGEKSIEIGPVRRVELAYRCVGDQLGPEEQFLACYDIAGVGVDSLIDEIYRLARVDLSRTCTELRLEL